MFCFLYDVNENKVSKYVDERFDVKQVKTDNM